jgi:tape measure domain-containing protein
MDHHVGQDAEQGVSVQDYELLLRVRADLNQALGGLDNLKRKLGDGDQGATRMAKSGDKAVLSMRALGSAIAAVGIAKLVKDYFSAADAASNMAAKVRLVTDSTKDQVAAQKALFALSQQTSSDLGTTTELYVKLAQSSDALRKNQTLLVGTTKLVNQALVLSGADAGTASGVVRQFAQAMASGVLRGDEFNSIMEGAPRLAQAMADGLQVPRGALREMAAQGQLTADKVISALTRQGDVIDREFSGMPITVGRAIQQVKTSLLGMIGDADATAGASRDVADAVQDLARTLESDEVKAGFAAMISGLVNVGRFAAEALSKVAEFTKFVGEAVARAQGNTAIGDVAGIDARLGQVNDRLTALKKTRDDLLASGKQGPGFLDILGAGFAGRAGAHQAAADIMSLADTSKVDAEIAKLEAEQKDLQIKLRLSQQSPAPKPVSTDLPTVTVHPDVPKTLSKDELAAAAAAAKAAAAAEAKAAAEAAAAHDQQIQSLIDLQGALDPTVKIYATFNAEREKQIELAARKGADFEAINALRDANIALAAQQRDAALAAQEQAASQKRLSDTMDAMPHYAGVDAVVGGAAGELLKAAQQSEALETWHATALKEHQNFYDELLKIDKAYNAEKAALDQAKAKLTLDTAVEGFGALAGAAKAAYGEQSKQYRIAFALQKAAALAQSILAIQTSIAESSKIGFPWNIVTIAGAVAQGVAILATINGTSFDVGGYTGPGGVKQPAGVVHKGEVVWSQRDVARAGGVGAVEAMRLGYRGYADGGFVHPLSGVPGPDLPSTAGLRLPASIANRESASTGASVNNKMRVYVLQDADQLAQRLATHPAMEKAVIAIAGENGTAIRAEW